MRIQCLILQMQYFVLIMWNSDFAMSIKQEMTNSNRKRNSGIKAEHTSFAIFWIVLVQIEFEWLRFYRLLASFPVLVQVISLYVSKRDWSTCFQLKTDAIHSIQRHHRKYKDQCECSISKSGIWYELFYRHFESLKAILPSSSLELHWEPFCLV